jgi:hypothetical protein
MEHATGTFDVRLAQQPADDPAAGPFGRLWLDKHFHGALEGQSVGQMLGAGTAVEGSAAYVALELFTGTLAGRRGTFILQHNGSMRRGTPSMNVTIVPDSGTDQLAGLVGRMTIVIAGGAHSYDLEYNFEPSA